MADVRGIITDALWEVRKIIIALRPSDLDDLGLIPALSAYARNRLSDAGVAVEAHLERPAQRLGPDVETTVFRIAQEAVNNITRHAAAQHAVIRFSQRNGTLELNVEDDGIGFDPDQVTPSENGEGLGLLGMKERAALIGGALELTSRPGTGDEHRGENPAARGDGEMNEKIRIMLVDDHEMVRAGLRALLKGHAEMEVVGEAADGESAVELARSLTPDVILMDIALRGNMNGIEATRQIRTENPTIQVLAVTAHDSPEYFFELMKAEAVGYVLKEATPSELFTAIRAAHRGEAYFYPSIARYLLNDYLRRVRSGHEDRVHYDGLTDREREILRLIANGHSNRQIGEMLVISINTAEAHRGHIMQKLNLHTRAELVKYAIKSGLID